jgi:hypothetical protein
MDEKPNQIRIKVKRRSEEPFEEVILFTNAAAPGEKKEIWWKFSKYLKPAEPAVSMVPPDRLYVPPEAILLLK